MRQKTSLSETTPKDATLVDDSLRRLLREVLRAELEKLLTVLGGHKSAKLQFESRSPTLDYLTPIEAASIVQVRASTVRAWVARGELPGHYAGRHLRIRRNELIEYMRRDKTASMVQCDNERIHEILEEES